MESKAEKYLPIGTVVMIKERTKKVVITGFCPISLKDIKKIYDYCGCIYPEVSLSSMQVFLLNHNQIDKIYHIGYDDEENKKFQTNLKQVMKNGIISLGMWQYGKCQSKYS